MSSGAAVLGLGLGGAAVALFVTSRSSNKAVSSTSSPRKPIAIVSLPAEQFRAAIRGPVWTPVTPTDIQTLLRTACGCVDARPLLADEDLAHCVWAAHWGSLAYPERAVAGDHPSVAEAVGAVKAAVKAARDGECANLSEPELDTELEPPHPGMPKLGDAAEPELAKLELELIEGFEFSPTPLGSGAPSPPPISLPSQQSALGQSTPTFEATKLPAKSIPTQTVATPVDVAALTRITPTPGYLYQVRAHDHFMGDGGVLARALHQAVLDAAQSKHWPADKAQAHANALAADAKARLAYLTIIQCGPWNDAMYATWGYGPADLPAAHGRAIRLMPRHDRVSDRLAAGQPPIRTLDRGTPSDKGSGSATGAGDQYELLWLPPLRSDALLDPTRVRQVVTEGLMWADGSSKYDPPPSIQALGIANAPAGPWGCTGVAA
jgi:hypothetical protein